MIEREKKIISAGIAFGVFGLILGVAGAFYISSEIDLEDGCERMDYLEENYGSHLGFDKKDFLLAGWVSLDQYNNQVVFEIKIVSTNQTVDDKIFTLPNKS